MASITFPNRASSAAQILPSIRLVGFEHDAKGRIIQCLLDTGDPEWGLVIAPDTLLDRLDLMDRMSGEDLADVLALVSEIRQ